jgi:hypothetical protein
MDSAWSVAIGKEEKGYGVLAWVLCGAGRRRGRGRHVNHCELCAQDKDEAMLLVQCGDYKRTVCGTCAWAVAQSLGTCGARERSCDNRNDPVPPDLWQILG